MNPKEIVTVKAKNDQRITATFYLPDGEAKAAALIVPAMGVVQQYYSSFASWLANQGYIVATFDYSGVGLSQADSLRQNKVTISDWAYFDCTAMVEALSMRAEGKSLYWIGHSLGGQIFGLVPEAGRVTKVINIAGGSGYWKENVPSLKWRAWWLWYFVVPIATRVYGYFPGKKLRKVGDLPAGVIRQWRRWCLNPDYMVGVEGEETRDRYEAVVTPISSFSFTDDELISKSNVDSLNCFYKNSNVKPIRISPAEIGVTRIGHFGFFKDRFTNSLWERYLLQELI